MQVQSLEVSSGFRGVLSTGSFETVCATLEPMPWSFNFMPLNQVLSVTISAPFTVRDLEPMLKAALEELSKMGSLRCLVDNRGIGFEPTVMDIYERPKVYARLGVPYSARFAIVTDSEYKQRRFMEDVTQNRGYHVRLFDSHDQAIRWLTEDRGSDP